MPPSRSRPWRLWLNCSRRPSGGSPDRLRVSGTVSYAAPEGQHDDLVLALSLCVFGARRLVAMPRPIALGRRSGFDKRAWT